MIDNTLGISVCGYQTNQLSEFLNRRTNMMNLQFGCTKCDKLHIGKKQNDDICPTVTIDSWKEEISEEDGGAKKLEDIFEGKEAMNEVKMKKYLGDIISKDGTNRENIRNRTNKAQGNINKIIKGLDERPYGKHFFKAAKLMREAILLGGLLTNSESWINVTQKDITDLEKPDITLQRKLLSVSGNPSKCFLQLELGIIPVHFVIMQKRLNFLQYILHESMDSMVRQVFEEQKEDSKKGDFKDLTDKDRISLDIKYQDHKIEASTKQSWKKFLKHKVKIAAFNHLLLENSTKEKTREVKFEDLKMSQYLEKNIKTTLSKLIFSIRSKTLDIKEYQPWKYDNNTCIACNDYPETMQHFATCASYRNQPCSFWKDINGMAYEKIIEVGLAVEKRIEERKLLIRKEEVGQA